METAKRNNLCCSIYTLIKKVLYMGVYQDIEPTSLQYRAISVTICASRDKYAEKRNLLR